MRRLRAEWERQNAVLMAFPHTDTDWARDGNLNQSFAPFVRIAQAIAYSQTVYILCKDAKQIRDLFCSTQKMVFIETDYNDTWCRDYGPVSIERDSKPALIDFKFDGWGGKFEASLDDMVNKNLHKKGYFGTTPMESVPFVLEGGSIESDGEGTILTTTKCLCNPNRNGGLSKSEVEENLNRYLGTKRVLWLENGYLEGDDTDSHIDMLARFTNKDTIAYIECNDSSDIHYHALKELKRELKLLKKDNGSSYNLIALPMCEPKYQNNHRLPASYANFLITNKAVLYPTYEAPKTDKETGVILKQIFPDKEIIPIPSLKLITQGGSIHCSTMQIVY